MKKAYSYIRWSSSLQGKEGRHSRARQKDSADEWVKKHGKGEYVLAAETFVDAAKSAFKGKHIAKDERGKAKGELQRFIQLVEEGTIKKGSVLLIDSFDRFSRLPPSKSLALFLQVIESGIGLVFTGSFDKRVIDTKLIDQDVYVLQFVIGEMVRSYKESEEKSRKIKKAKQDKIARLKAGEVVPHNNVPKYLSFDHETKLYIHNTNTLLVKRLVQQYLAGKSLYMLSKTFNAEKIKTFRRGFEWSPCSIRSIFRNRILLGEYLGNKRFAQPIISEDEFNRLQVLLAHNQKYNRGKQADYINIFRGIAYCECGRKMNILSQSADYRRKAKWIKPYRYLRCSTVTASKLTCPHKKVIKLDELEEEFFGNFLLKSPDEIVQQDNGEVNQISASIATLQLEINNLTGEISQLVNLAARIGLPELTARLQTLEAQRSQAKVAIDDLSLQHVQIQTAPSQFDDLKQLCKAFDKTGGVTFIDANLSLQLSPKARAFDEAIHRLNEALKDNEIRMKIRTILPSLIGKMTINTSNGSFEVFNRSGKSIYRSLMGTV